MDIKIIIAQLLILVSMLTIFNTGFNGCIKEELRHMHKPFKSIMYTIFSMAIILALLSLINPLFMKISQGIGFFFFIVVGMINICSLYLPE